MAFISILLDKTQKTPHECPYLKTRKMRVYMGRETPDNFHEKLLFIYNHKQKVVTVYHFDAFKLERK